MMDFTQDWNWVSIFTLVLIFLFFAGVDRGWWN